MLDIITEPAYGRFCYEPQSFTLLCVYTFCYVSLEFLPQEAE